MISCVVVFEGRVTRVVNDDTHQWFLGSCMKLSDRGRGVEIFISKLKRRKNGKIDLSCISV